MSRKLFYFLNHTNFILELTSVAVTIDRIAEIFIVLNKLFVYCRIQFDDFVFNLASFYTTIIWCMMLLLHGGALGFFLLGDAAYC